MKKREAIRLLPKLKELKSEAKFKLACSETLLRQAIKLQITCDKLINVTIHDGVPLRVVPRGRDIEVSSACDEVTRHAYASRVGTKYTMNVYKGSFTEVDGIRVDGTFTRPAATTRMKNWVAHGKL
jgi:hypothetical protein